MAHWFTKCAVVYLLTVLTACSSNPGEPNPTRLDDTSPITHVSDPLPTVIPSPSATALPLITPDDPPSSMATPSLSPSPTSIDPPLSTFTPAPMEHFTTPLLRGGAMPQSYLTDECEYLRLRWTPEGSPIGTVVVPVMFHSIVKGGGEVTDPKDISEEEFQAFIKYAQTLGFETVTTAELLAFLESNAHIPARSMLLIVDDRRPGLLEEHFMPVLTANDWTVTAAYIADPDSFDWAWEWMERLYTSGRLDVQSHGATGQLYIVPSTPLESIQAELIPAITTLEEHFGQTPLAFIWPGGNFTLPAVQIARQAGYELGFSAYSRGPLMFNWIPLGEEEHQMDDPLMVLPRAWSNSVNVNLDQAVQIAAQARTQALDSYPAEAAYYRTYCGGDLPPLEGDLLP